MDIVRSRESLPNDLDSLIVLGKQFGIGQNQEDIKNSPDGLSIESRFNVIAAALLWSTGMRLLLSGNGSKKCRFPQSASEYLANNFKHIPYEAYENPDFNSVQTLDSSIVAPIRLASEGYTRSALITVGYHAKRANKLFEKSSKYSPRKDVPPFNIVRCVVASENIVAERSQTDYEEVAEWQRLGRVKAERVKEFALRNTPVIPYLGYYAILLYRPSGP